MNLRTLLMLFVPPVAALAIRRLQAALATRPPRVRVNYGDFVLECDSSHHLPQILAVWPDFGRPLAEIVLALNVQPARVVDVDANIGDTALLLARFAPGARVLCIA